MAALSRLRLLHWNADASAPTRKLLADAGFLVEYDAAFSSALMRAWRKDPPDAFVIDLSRLPAQGMEIAIAIRQSPSTKQIPIIFCDGLAEKVNRVREALPDAHYCTLDSLLNAVKTARPLQSPVKPAAMMNRYGHRTAAQKLGIFEGSQVAVISPPQNFERLLGELPSRIEFTERLGSVTLCFVHSIDEVRADISRVRGLAARTKLWILWRKKGAPGHNGVTESMVRDTGLDLGLVDYKICSVDTIWSAMCFVQRK